MDTSQEAAKPRRTEIHERLVELQRLKAILEAEELALLREAENEKVYRYFACRNLCQYMETQLGYRAIDASDRIRVSKLLEDVPQAISAMTDGKLPFAKVSEISRIATHSTERPWLDACVPLTVADIKRLRRGRQPGDRPDDPVDPALLTTRMELHLTTDQRATIEEACCRVRKSVRDATREQVLSMGAKALLRGGSDKSVPPYQISFVRCECGQAFQVAGGERIPVDPVVLEKAWCDASVLGFVDRDGNERVKSTVSPSVRKKVLARDGGRCRVPGCREASTVDCHHVILKSEGGRARPSNVACLCEAHHNQVHFGLLHVTGDANTVLTFSRADGMPVGSDVGSLDDLQAGADAFNELRKLGLQEGEIRKVFVEVWREVKDSGLDSLEATREALIAGVIRRVRPS